MSLPVAYATIIIVWSTTPLGIAWSNEGFTPFAAILLRMTLAAVIGAVLLRLLKIELSWTKQAWHTYGYSLLGIYVALTLTYISAQYIPSGLISLVYAMSPLFSTLLSSLLMEKADFTRSRFFAFALAFIGLAIIFSDDLVVQGKGVLGLCLLILAVFLYALSGILVQKIRLQAHPLSITVGTLLVSLPMFFVSWFLIDGELPSFDFGERSTWAVVYLAVFGSLIGFVCYFLIVKRLGATAVTMVTLMTPVLALTLGNTLNKEPLTENMVIGTCMVLIGLAFYYGNGTLIGFARKHVGTS